jgi:hypothetical protein
MTAKESIDPSLNVVDHAVDINKGSISTSGPHDVPTHVVQNLRPEVYHEAYPTQLGSASLRHSATENQHQSKFPPLSSHTVS